MRLFRRTGRGRAARYQPLAARADTALLSTPLTGDQVQRLRSWAKTSARSGELGALVAEHSVAVNPAAWREHLRAAPSVLEVVTVTGRISRKDVAEVAEQCARSGVWTPLLVAAYAWGQGRNGYGPYRLANILHAGARAEPSVETVLGAAVGAMGRGTAADGYGELRGAVRGLGPAFFTKFLYFAGGQVAPRHGPKPLVLDAVVARQVRQVAAARAASAGIDEAAGLCAWLWSSGAWSQYRYAVWLDFADRATQQLAAAPGAPRWPHRADLLELATFRGGLSS